MQRILGLVVLLSCLSCGEKLPREVIPKEQMPSVLLDMHLTDGQLASMPIDSARTYRDVYYQAIFDRHRIDSNAFKRSIQFYSTRPHILNELYVDVEKRLEALNRAEQKAIEDNYNAQRRADSIKNARQLDSLRRIARDSLDFKRKRYLLFLNAPDSVYGRPDSITHEKLNERMLETIGLKKNPAERQRPVPPSTVPPEPPRPVQKAKEKPLLRPLEKIK